MRTLLKETIAITLRTHSTVVKLVWMNAKSGNYTVKNGYNSIRKEKENSDVDSASTSYELPTTLWNKIWHMNTIRKIKFFLWSACQNAMPTKENLFKTKFVEEPTCSLCHVEV